MELKGRKMFILGERDGVQAQAVGECMKAAGAEVVYMDTQCFV